MKNIVLLMVTVVMIQCKTTSEQTAQTHTEETAIQGEFLYWNNAAVLKTDTEIYGVIIDEKMHELNDKCIPLKKDEYDMIMVSLKGIIQKNPVPESWNELIQIKEILAVPASKAASNMIINNQK